MIIKTIDMQLMRYINLFERISHVSTTNCFIYNNTLIFAVPRHLVSKAVGRDGDNIKRINEILRKKIKVIGMIENKREIADFVADIVSPISFTKLEIINGEVLINGSRQNKAALIGRNRQREQELENILKKFFEIKKLRIV